MKLLKRLIKKDVSGETANGNRTVDSSTGQNAVAAEWHSPWRPFHCGVHESRRHVGCSSEGFHAGVEVCYRAGMGWIDWGKALPTPEIALAESARLENTRHEAVNGACNRSADLTPQEYAVATCRNAVWENAILRVYEAVLRMKCAPVQGTSKHLAELERTVRMLGRIHADLSATTEPVLRESERP
jgi:hypothetical protein